MLRLQDKNVANSIGKIAFVESSHWKMVKRCEEKLTIDSFKVHIVNDWYVES